MVDDYCSKETSFGFGFGKEGEERGIKCWLPLDVYELCCCTVVKPYDF